MYVRADDASPPIPAVIIKALKGDTIVEPDGSYTTITHAETLATNESAEHNIAQHRVEYSESMETAEVLEAFTRKVDGRILAVDQTQIFAQAPPGSPRVPMFNDRKQKVIVFPNVSAEDTVVYTIKQTRKAPFAEQFFFGGVFLRGVAFEDVRVNIALPKEMAAHVQVQGVEHQVEESGEGITHKFFYRNPRPPVTGSAALSPWDTEPHYIVSTFPDYGAVAAAYRQLAAGKAAVIPRIEALADEITAGVSDRREQAHKIYDWVSTHIRYVAVFLGNGGYEPHEAAKILENGYGDCKDHVVLLEALLKARGIESLPVLADTGNRYRAPEAATPALFNHVLSYLPEFDIYADSTVGMAPFGTLPITEYGKPVAIATEPGAPLAILPLVASEENEEKLQTMAQLMADGTVSGQSTTVASGSFGVKLRQLAASVEMGGPERWAESYFKSLGWPGKASFQFDPPRDRLAPSYAFSASFELEARPEFLDGKAFELPAGIRMLVRPGEFLLGPWTLPKTAPTPCFSGHQIEELSLTLPPGRDIESLPRGKTIENPYLRYQSDWRRDGQVVTVRREMTVKLPVAVCRDEIREQLAKVIAEIRGDYRAEIALKPLVQ
jgi:transglutaminase-like putative cysteine protease